MVGRFLRGLSKPIAEAPMPSHPHLQMEQTPLLLYCPNQGGWHTGVWFDGGWWLHFNMEEKLEPVSFIELTGLALGP